MNCQWALFTIFLRDSLFVAQEKNIVSLTMAMGSKGIDPMLYKDLNYSVQLSVTEELFENYTKTWAKIK